MQKVTGAIVVCVCLLTVLFPPNTTHASLWGGRFEAVIPCWNNAIYVAVSAPLGGAFLWTPVTKTYEHGAPSHAGQYGLGLAGPPYMCIVSPYPVVVLSGTMMLMIGTSK